MRRANREASHLRRPVSAATYSVLRRPRCRSRRETPAANKYAKLPTPIRPEDMIATQEARPQPADKGEHDRETEWLLRTTGLFI